jgi:DNA-binding response OmpR family regulator
MRHLLEKAFQDSGYDVASCRDGWGLLGRLAAYFLFTERDDEECFDLVVSDIRMPFLSGLEILECGDGVRGFPPTILITAFGDEETHAAARRASAAALFDKPFDIQTLLERAAELAPPFRGGRSD